MTATASLPIISLSKYKTPQELAVPLYEASTTAGFFYITDHCIPEDTIKKTFQISKEYFLNGTQVDKDKYPFDTRSGLVSALTCFVSRKISLSTYGQ